MNLEKGDVCYRNTEIVSYGMWNLSQYLFLVLHFQESHTHSYSSLELPYTKIYLIWTEATPETKLLIPLKFPPKHMSSELLDIQRVGLVSKSSSLSFSQILNMSSCELHSERFILFCDLLLQACVSWVLQWKLKKPGTWILLICRQSKLGKGINIRDITSPALEVVGYWVRWREESRLASRVEVVQFPFFQSIMIRNGHNRPSGSYVRHSEIILCVFVGVRWKIPDTEIWKLPFWLLLHSWRLFSKTKKRH